MASKAMSKLRAECSNQRVSKSRAGSRKMRLDIPEADHLLALYESGERLPFRVCAVDPSVRATGWCTAWFDYTPDGLECVMERAGVVKTDKPAPGLYPVPVMVGGVMEEIEGADMIVFEFPEIYGMAKEEDPNSILPLTAVLGGLVCAKRWLGQFAYHPREWKGELPKDVHQTRELRAFPDVWQRAYLPDHNAADAALLMYWFAVKVGASIKFMDP